jgi:hypothetical protein
MKASSVKLFGDVFMAPMPSRKEAWPNPSAASVREEVAVVSNVYCPLGEFGWPMLTNDFLYSKPALR